MNLLIVLSRFPYPLDKGDKLRAYYQIKELSKNNTIYLLCTSDVAVSENELNQLRPYCKEIVVKKINKFQIALHLILSFFNKYPFQVNYFTNLSVKSLIGNWVRDKKIDLVYMQMVRMMNNIPHDLKVPVYVDYMDALSAGMNKRLAYTPFYFKWVVQSEYSKLVFAEKKCAERFNGFSIISKQDASQINSNQLIDIIPNGIDQRFFDEHTSPKSYDLIFTGNMGYHPNVIAAVFLVKKILPILSKKGYSFKVCLSGTTPAKEVLNLKSSKVEVTGFVPEITDYLKQSSIFVAPMFSGSGLQNKLLEAMAMSMPVVTTDLANNALGAIDGESVVIANTAEEFADKIIELIKDSAKAESIGMNAQSYVRSNYNWENINVKLETSFKAIVKR